MSHHYDWLVFRLRPKKLGLNLTSLARCAQDMDLRAEKEKQRSALIKLRELSSADREFADKCESLVIKGLGLSPPVLSRLEMQVNYCRQPGLSMIF